MITRRLTPTWFDATPEEQSALMTLVNEVKVLLDQRLQPRPDGYNVGFNAGDAAGQTVPHVHVHVIPRYHGDVPDPRGGVRHVIPTRGNYLAPPTPVDSAQTPPANQTTPDVAPPGSGASDSAEFRGLRATDLSSLAPHQRPPLMLAAGVPRSPLWDHLAWRIAGARAVDILAAFVQLSGLDVIEQQVFLALRNHARIRILVSDYLCISDPLALRRLLGWSELIADELHEQRLQVRLIELDRLPGAPASFHPKAWHILDDHSGFIAVGSSNLSRPALQTGVEWNLLSESHAAPLAHAQVASEFAELWQLASPLSSPLIDSYAERVRTAQADRPESPAVDHRLQGFTPRPWQRRALDSLQSIRQSGYTRALVAVATGMGKTWLAAFDALQFGLTLGRRPRVLVIAHRAHLLAQAEATLSLVLDQAFTPAASSWFAGNRDELNGILTVATIQKLARPEGLTLLAEQQFDYVVIDEVHHAHAPGYRRVLARLNCRFILGLTATPDRADGVDIASLFDDHLAWYASIGDGIAEDSLVPFHYIGIKDTVDFQQIPWRNGRFDQDRLEELVQHSDRMQRLWTAMQQHPAARTIVFCCSRRHALWTRDWLRRQGLTAAAVFSGTGGDGCGESLQQLRTGELQALCAVDMFNEGLDIPAVDRVIFLRPTESGVIFLQQLGRGLRACEGKSRLLVLDFVGNHRVFAQRMVQLLSLNGRDGRWTALRRWLDGEPPELPPGCLLDVELAARELLQNVLPKGRQQALEAYRALRDARDHRPGMSEVFAHGLQPRLIAVEQGSWFGFLQHEGDLTADELRVQEQFADWLQMLETTKMNKCYKMVVLRVLLDEGRFFRGLDLPSLACACRRFLQQHETLRRDLEGEAHAVDHNAADDRTWEAWWNKWPVDRWLNPQAGQTWFVNRAGNLQYSRPCPADLQATLEAMTGELVDWRLAQYSVNRSLRIPNAASQSFDAKVSHAKGRPILFLPDKARHPDRPVGPTRVWLPDGTEWVFKLVKIACNVAGPVGDNSNQLPELLRTWFGPQAGLPGTVHQVRFQWDGEHWTIGPLSGMVGGTADTVTANASVSSVGDVVTTSVAPAEPDRNEDRGQVGPGNWERLELDPGERARYRTHVPVYDLTAAAGGWGPEGSPTELGWLRVSGQRLEPGMFVARVIGRSMEPRIPDGAWCLFRPCPAGSRQGRLLLVQVNTHLDPEDGGRYTVKQYYSRKNQQSGDWSHDVIELRPLNSEYGSITITPADAPDLRIIGEFVTVVAPTA